MAPSKDPSKAVKSRSSPSRLESSNTVNGSERKLGSLSSHQMTLSFGNLPSASRSSTPARTSNGTKALPKARHDPLEDRRLMPPPPADFRPSTSKPSSSSVPARPASVVIGKVKAKQESEIVTVLDGLDDDCDGGTLGQTEGMWADAYGPTHLVDLASSKPKVGKVRAWLHEALHGIPEDYIPLSDSQSQSTLDKVRKYKRILLVTGPPGAGKTTTVRLLAKDMGIELMEWGEGVEEWSLGAGFERESAVSKMSIFLSRQSYASLNLSKEGSSSSAHSTPTRPRVILLTSLPNLTHLPTRDAFHAQLLAFCQNYSASSCPLVLIHSDAGSGGKAEESWMDRERGGREGALELVGREVRDGPWCHEADFIPMAPTFVTKALKRVLSLAVPRVSDRPPDSAVQLISLSCNGDLRSAINSLQLLCNRTDRSTGSRKRKEGSDGADSPRSSKRSRGKGSRGGKGAKLDVSEDLRAVLDAVTRREQSLNVFHALGKVLYNKRITDAGIKEADHETYAAIDALPPDEPLPAHLRSLARAKSMVQLEHFIPTVPLDASSFTLWIQESIPMFCSDVDQASAAADELCHSDIMKTDDDIWQSSPQAIGYALHIAVRGALMALPAPVPRNHQKILKPQFFDSYRLERENLALLNSAAAHVTKRAIAASLALSELQLSAASDEAPWGGLASRLTLASELVPMMIKIQSMGHKPLLPSSVKHLMLPPWTTSQSLHETELGSTAMDAEVGYEEYEQEAAGEDGLGSVAAGEGWDDATDATGLGEIDGLEEDDIDDWD